MPALSRKVSRFCLLAFVFVWLFSLFNSVLAVDKVSQLNYQVDGSRRVLSFELYNWHPQVWHPQFKLVIIDQAGKVKHVWRFDNQVEISGQKAAMVQLGWEDNLVIGNKETIKLYLKEADQWQLVGQVSRNWQAGIFKKIWLIGFIGSVVSAPLVFRPKKTFPNKLFGFYQEGGEINAQRHS